MPMGLRGPSGPKKIIKLTFRELAFLHRKLRDCGLGVVYILNGGATLLVGTSISLNRLRAVSLFLVRRTKRTRHENDYALGGKKKKKRKRDCSQCRTSMKAGIHLGSYIFQPIGFLTPPPPPPPPLLSDQHYDKVH